MQFDVNKTKLIYFHFQKFLDLKNELYSVKIKKTVFQLKKLIKYLNIWLDFKLFFKTHMKKKIVSAQKIFMQIKRFFNIEKKFFFQAIRQFYIICIFSITNYEISIW